MDSPPTVLGLQERLEAFHLEPAGVDPVEEAARLAADLQRLALTARGPAGQRQERRLARLMDDPEGKAFLAAVTDQTFRATAPGRAADQLRHLIRRHGVPRFFSTWERLQLRAFSAVGGLAPGLLLPLVLKRVRGEMGAVVLPGEPGPLAQHLRKRAKEGTRVNLNHLGEAVLGEGEAKRRLDRYLGALARPDVDCISVKVSTIASQLELLAWVDTLDTLAERLQRLYRVSLARPTPALVYLDMEEYRDLDLTLALFRRVLDQPEFARLSAGIVLQAYLPDSWSAQQALTDWARARVAAGGAPIRLRLVKGANLAMEQVEADLHGWTQAPYGSKVEVDANFKRMLDYACRPEHTAAVHIGVASHNMFDIAYGLVLRSVRGVERQVGFEMLEGMADAARRVVQGVAGDMLVYGPAVRSAEVISAIAYLIRRLDENTGPENFLRHGFGLSPDTDTWRDQERRFREACARMTAVDSGPRRTQDRALEPMPPEPEAPFANEPDTDWTLPANRAWIAAELERCDALPAPTVPLQIAGELVEATAAGTEAGEDPGRLDTEPYRYVLADEAHIERCLDAAQTAATRWANTGSAERSGVLAAVAQGLRNARGRLLSVLVSDAGKGLREGDAELSEAIDFAEYYRRSLADFEALEDVALRPLGVVLVAPPWNFPLAIPAGGVFAALMAGNAVILKPAPQTVRVAWELASVCWEAGVPKDVLQFVACRDEPIGSSLIRDERVDAVVLTGGTSTARLFHRLRPGLTLFAETGGKNALIVTALADRDLAIVHAVQSAFGHSGQKCSACSLLICEAEVYDDPSFRARLKDAAESWHVGVARDMRSRVTPLVDVPGDVLRRGLTQLDEGESWLLQPASDPTTPGTWSPGIRWGVREGGFCHRTELFGPVLSVMRADDLDHAVRIANAVDYGLTSGLHSLDAREQERWLAAIDAGNLYVNRGTTGAIVRRQPFGGRKASSFGPGAKAGGPNYVVQLMRVTQQDPPKQTAPLSPKVSSLLQQLDDVAPRSQLVHDSAASYAFWWSEHFSRHHDPSQLLGQDNIFRYQPCRRLALRLGEGASLEAAVQVVIAAATAGTPLDVTRPPQGPAWPGAIIEDDTALAARVRAYDRVRALGLASDGVAEACLETGTYYDRRLPLANGRLELLRVVREQAVSIDHHRYGNIDATRTPLLAAAAP